MGKKDSEIKGEPYSRRIIETSGEIKEFDKFPFIEIKEVGNFRFDAGQEDSISREQHKRTIKFLEFFQN